MTGIEYGPALLFCPADRPDRFTSAVERSDAAILDLEDAVGKEAKTAARGAVIDSELDPTRVIVRVSAPHDAAHASDLASLAQTDYRTIIVAKAESAKALRKIDPRFRVIAMCETAKGVVAAEKIAELDNVIGLMWGSEDLLASLGGTSSRRPNGRYRDVARYARERILIAAAAAGKSAIDAVNVDIADTKRLAEDAKDAAASGFAATACIHPSQVSIIRNAYRPDAATLAMARALLSAAKGTSGVFAYKGRMIDEPMLRHARITVSRAAD